VRVVVADDAVILREGLERLLREVGFEVAGLAADGDELLGQVEGFSRTSRSSTSGCRRPTATRACRQPRRSGSAAQGPASWSCRSTCTPATP
jgi:hypothetical protein